MVLMYHRRMQYKQAQLMASSTSLKTTARFMEQAAFKRTVKTFIPTESSNRSFIRFPRLENIRGARVEISRGKNEVPGSPKILRLPRGCKWRCQDQDEV